MTTPSQELRATDLRIGNLLQNKDGKLETVFSIDEKGINGIHLTDDLRCGEVEYETLKPIPLSEEWLKRFSFVKRSGFGFNYYDLIFDVNAPGHTTQSERSITVNENCTHCFTDGTFAAEVRHVHSLQNLIFALTGYELKLNNQ